jgi:hypothetical protein
VARALTAIGFFSARSAIAAAIAQTGCNVTLLAATLPQGKEKDHDRERRQDRSHHESGGRKFHPMMEIHFHPRGQAEQEKQQRGINQNYADPLFVVGFHQ